MTFNLCIVLMAALAGFTTLEALLSRALSGEDRALDELIRGLTPVIRNHARRALGEGSGSRRRGYLCDLDDITQDTLIYLFDAGWKSLRDFDPQRRSLKGWIEKPTRWIVSAHLRRIKEHPLPHAPVNPGDGSTGIGQDAINSQPSTEPGPEDAVTLAHDFKRWEVAFLAGQSPRFQLLYRLLVLRRMDPASVAQMVGTSRGAVDQGKYEIIKRMKKLPPPEGPSLAQLADHQCWPEREEVDAREEDEDGGRRLATRSTW